MSAPLIHRPKSVDDLVDFVVQRVLDHLGVQVEITKRWTGKATRGRR